MKAGAGGRRMAASPCPPSSGCWSSSSSPPCRLRARLQARRPVRRHRPGLDPGDPPPASPIPSTSPSSGARCGSASLTTAHLPAARDARRLRHRPGRRAARATAADAARDRPLLDELPDPHLRLEGAAAPRGRASSTPSSASASSSEQAPLLYTPGAVLLVMVYTFLPFAILPIYAAAEKFDFRLLEAARDLGAAAARAPSAGSSSPASAAACSPPFLVVFIPALGLLRHPRPRRRPRRRDARQQDRPAGLRRPQPAPGQRPLGRSSSWPSCCRWPRSWCCRRRSGRRRSDPRGGRVRRSRFPLAITWLLLAFFYLPIVVAGRELVQRRALRRRLARGSPSTGTPSSSSTARSGRRSGTRLLIAVGATAVSVVLGTSRRVRPAPLPAAGCSACTTPSSTRPLVVPEILMGISLLLFFAAVGPRARPVHDLPGPRHLLRQLRRHGRAGAAAGFRRLGRRGGPDLGAGWWTITWRILLPLLAPGIAGRGAPRLHPLDRRLRHLVLRRRPRQHHAADPRSTA